MIEGEGTLITDKDEKGYDIPFLTTAQILEQLEKFGFYIVYDVKSNLPDETFGFLQQMMLLGYDKITKVLLQKQNKDGDIIWEPTILVFKSVTANEDLYSYGEKLTRQKYMKKVDENIVLNVTHQEGIKWDWVTSYYNISDIMDENLDSFPSSDPIITDPGFANNSSAESSPDISCPEGYTQYSDTPYSEDYDDGSE